MECLISTEMLRLALRCLLGTYSRTILIPIKNKYKFKGVVLMRGKIVLISLELECYSIITNCLK
jgi:hypothetical protein